jgi:hypothetical protein
MKAKIIILLAISNLLFCSICYSQDNRNAKTQLKEIPLESKHNFATWRVDYYICTGIAYAKSLGKSVEDFTKFVGENHDLTNPNNQTLSGVAETSNLVITNYQGGKYEIISESDSVIVAKSNRPYKIYYKDGPMLGVTIDEFEKYLFGHVAIMASKINIDFKYEITEDEVLQTFSYEK